MAECNPCFQYLSAEDIIRLTSRCIDGKVVQVGSKLNQPPIIPDGTPTSAFDVTDTGFKVVSSVDTSIETVVTLVYGLVSETYTDFVTAAESPVSSVGDVNFTLTGLEPYTDYYFRVKAVSAAGTSYSQEFVQKTEGWWYGIEFDETQGTSAAIRIASSDANMSLHASLPIQSRQKRCILRNDNSGVVEYYLHNDDSTLKADGSAATLDGSAGQVMVEIPQFYYKIERAGNIARIKISDYNLPDFTFSPKIYLGAFEGAVKRSTSQLMSVINATADFRGGNNNAAWDAQSNSLLGKPATVVSLTNFRAFARNNGAKWSARSYLSRAKMNLLYMIEYANRHVQAAYNEALTAQGYKQGGLGGGVSNVNSTNWNTFSGNYPFVPCGRTASLGNKSGFVNYVVAGFTGGDITVLVPSYRGVEQPYGHIWEWEDGILYNIQANDAGAQSQIFICDNPANYADVLANYRHVGLLPRNEGYITRCLLDEGLTIPTEATGGSSTTRYSDYFYTSIPASGSGIRGSLVSASGIDGAFAGLFFLITNYVPALSAANVGSRPCFIP